jgi:CheY-like chemotaxis protein
MEQRRRRLLLVDDTELFLELERTFLQRSGYEIVTARSGEEALEKARSLGPDLVLLDLNMPGMEGDEVCREIKGDPDLKDIHVLMVTTRGREEDRARCIDAGCDGYLTKPINRADLLGRIRQALHERVRILPRIPIAAPVRYVTPDGSQHEGVTLNISPGGMFVVTDAPPERGTRLRLTCALPGGDRADELAAIPRPRAGGTPLHVTLDTEVVWTTGALGGAMVGFGLRFTEPDSSAARLVERYLEEWVAT